MAKMNQRTKFALITFLVWILSFHSTSCNSFILGVQASQRSPKTPSTTIQSTNNSPAITTSSFLQLPNDSPAKQHPVPHNGPAHFKQPSVPMTTTSTGLQADNDCHSSLNDVTALQAFPATTATMTATMTQVPTMTTAITKATIKLVKCFLHPSKTGANNATAKSENLLLHAQIGSAITAALNAQNLLLLSIREDSAIMLAMHAIYSLQLIVESFSTGTKQVAPATIHNNLFKLIVALASERARFAPYIFDNAFTYANKLNHEGLRAQATSRQASKLIVNYFKISFHFCEDCRIFYEGEWQVEDNGYAIVKQ